MRGSIWTYQDAASTLFFICVVCPIRLADEFLLLAAIDHEIRRLIEKTRLHADGFPSIEG